LSAAGNNMYVKMRHALTHAIVHRDECSMRLHSLLYRACQRLRVREERFDQIRRQIHQRLVMLFGNQQTMAGEDRAMIEKSDADVVFKDDTCSDFATRDFAEETCMNSSRHSQPNQGHKRRRISFLSIRFAAATALRIELSVPILNGL